MTSPRSRRNRDPRKESFMLWMQDERGQATAEYALVIVAAAAIALTLILWAASTGTLAALYDAVVAKVTSYV